MGLLVLVVIYLGFGLILSMDWRTEYLYNCLAVRASKRVSVLVPCRNRESVVGRALLSAVSQGEIDKEIIVIDDASDDRTPLIVAAFVGRFPCVKLIAGSRRQKTFKVRVDGLRACSGVFVFCLDSDDEMLNGTLNKVHKAAITMGADVAEVGALEKWQGERSRPASFGRYPGRMIEGREVRRLFILGKFGWSLVARLIKRDLWLNGLAVLGEPGCSASIARTEDRLHFACVCLGMKMFYMLEGIGYLYYGGRADSTTSSNPDDRLRDQRLVDFYIRMVLGSSPPSIDV